MHKLLYIVLLGLITGCSNNNEEAEKASVSVPAAANPNYVSLTDAQIKNAGIETGKPEMRTMQSVLKVNGLIDLPPQNLVTISFPTGGYVKSTNLLQGMRVRKGQVLAVMQDQSFVQMQEDYLTAKNKLAFLQKEYERQKFLNTSKAVSDKVFEQAQNDFQNQGIAVKSLQQKLLIIGINPARLNANNISRTVNLYAPISGFVTTINVNTGKYVNPTDILFELVDPKDLHLVLTIFERDLNAVQPGQQVKAYMAGDTTKGYTAEIILVNRNLDDNRSALVHCHFTGATPPLSPGMFMSADVLLTNRAAIAVPEDAVVRSGDKEYVFIEQPGKQFQLTPVSTQAGEKGFIAITSMGTDFLNQVIIVKSAYAALMKMKNTGGEEE